MLTEIYQRISAHKSFDHTEEIAKRQTLRFIESHPNSLERSCLPGHLTGSAWLVAPDRRSTVLIHHKKLNRWLQPGGHADSNGNLFQVALDEASEETGLDLSIFIPVTNLIFDIDVHKIPKRGAEPAHTHYDIRYIFRYLKSIYRATMNHIRYDLSHLMKSKNSITPLLLRGWC